MCQSAGGVSTSREGPSLAEARTPMDRTARVMARRSGPHKRPLGTANGLDLWWVCMYDTNDPGI